MSSTARNAAVGVIAVALIAFAVYRFGRAGGAAPIPSQYTIEGVCLACKNEVRADASLNQPQPLRCPSCGQDAVYEWMYCNACKKRFVPNLARPDPQGPPRVPVVPSCSACGSTNVTAYIPEDPTQQPVGDAPLPPWPPK